ncbi:hypothetical protein GCM10028820_16870 [Tessaracoccus terricola]
MTTSRTRSTIALAGVAALLASGTVLGTAPAVAEEPTDGLLASYAFTARPDDGATVANTAAGSTFGPAVVQNPADQLWTDNALTFVGGAKDSSGNWVMLPDDLLSGQESATIQMEVKVDASMLSNFHFLYNIGADGNTQQYLFASARQNVRSAITTGSNGAERNAAASFGLDADRWYSLATVVDGEAGTIQTWLDGVLVGEGDTAGLTPASIADQSLNTIGRAPWPDPLLKGAVATFRVYDRALGADELATISDDDAALHPEAFTDAAAQVLTGLRPITADTPRLTLPSPQGEVAWTSTMEQVQIAEDGITATVTQPAAGEADVTGTLTATASVRGQQATREIPITIKAEAADADEYGYLFVHFVEDADGYAERIYLDVSNGNNPMSWTRLNGGEPILTSDVGTTGVRDPVLVRNPETGTYYIVGTDLRVWIEPGSDCPAGVPEGYCPWYQYTHHSRNLVVWESQDLVTWSEPRLIEVAPPTAGRAWAPEATWDEALGAFVLYWSSNIFDEADPEHAGAGSSETLYGTTTDFTQSDWDTRNPDGASQLYVAEPGTDTIDMTVKQFRNTAGELVTYRAFKENGGRGLVFQSTTEPQWWEVANSDSWTTHQTQIGQAEYGQVEGPLLFQENGEDRWFLYADQYGGSSQGYRPFVTTDIGVTDWTALPQNQLQGMLPETKHGGVLNLTKAEYDVVRAADVVAVDEVNVTTAPGVQPELPDSVTVHTSDGASRAEAVTWDAIPDADLEAPGVTEVSGALSQANLSDNTDAPVRANALVTVAGSPLEQATAGLFLPGFLAADAELPSSFAGADVIWDGAPVAPATGISEPVELTATLTLDGASTTKEFSVRVLAEDSPQAAGYTRSPAGPVTSALHLALLEDGTTETLNLGEGVLFAEADFDVADTLRGETRTLLDPHLFRLADGGFGVVAVRGDADGRRIEGQSLLVFESPDLISWSEKTLAVQTSGTVTNPAAALDAATGSYRIWWTDAAGADFRAESADFTSLSRPVPADREAELAEPALQLGISGSVPGNAVTVTADEAEVLRDRFTRVVNTTVDDGPTIELALGADVPGAADLGGVLAHYSDGSSAPKRVSWDAEDLAAVDTAVDATYTVSGTIDVTDFQFPLVAGASADPTVFVHEGSYYWIATNEAGGQRGLDIRKADTVAGLRNATPVRIVEDGGHLAWAPEVHEVGGQLYLFYARGRTNVWNTVQAVVKPLRVGGDPANPADWEDYRLVTLPNGDPLVDPATGAITLDMTYIHDGDNHYVMWSESARTSPAAGAYLSIASIDPSDPSVLTSDPVQIRRPLYGWDRQTTPVVEGPFALYKDGRIVVTISGSGVDNTYVVGSLTADAGSDLLDPASWTGSNAPLLTSASVTGQYGPGHNSYFTSLDGDLMTAIHAKPNGGARQSGVRLVQWRADGITPVLDLVAEREVLPANRWTSATIVVGDGGEPVAEVADLAIPAAITGDLPATAGSEDITWAASPEGWISADGEVTLPDDAPVDVRVTATVGTTVVEAAARILPSGGQLLSYPLEGGNVFLGEDLLTSPDSRRSDALHVALDDGAGGWTPLNNGKAIGYATWEGDQKQASGADWQLGSPTFFRHHDGSLGVVASANNNRPVIYVFDLDENLFVTGERKVPVALAADARVGNPRIVADAATGDYKVYWSDEGGTGDAQVTVLADLSGNSRPVTSPSSVTPTPWEGATPDGALAAEASVTTITPAERDAFQATYGALVNTGVRAPSVTVAAGEAVDLPATVTLEYGDGSTKDLAVEWSQAELDAARAAGPGTHEVTGTVLQDDYAYPFIEERADPHIFFNPDDGHYYATGSYYEDHDGALLDERTSYGAVGLRRATTIEGLADAPEHLLRTSEVGDRWGGFFWAPEVHRINGTWYMVVGAHDYGSSGRPAGAAYTWTSATILIPFLGTTQDIVDGKMLDPTYWGDDDAIRPLQGAPSFDVNYFLDESSGQGYWIMPRSAGLEVVEAVTADGEFPALAGTPSRIKDLQWPFEYGVWDGSITAANPEGNDQGIIEGPYTFTHGDFHYLIYSGATVDKYYNLAVMRAEVGSDLKDRDSWTVQPFSAFNAYDTYEGSIGGAPHVGGGHNSVVVDEHGNLVLVYHARPYPDPHAGQPGAGGLFDPDRHTSVKAINVRANGQLVLDLTPAQELADEFRTVTALVTITGGTGPTVEPSEEPTSGPGEPSPAPTVTVTADPPQGDVYSIPGFHSVNGRWWHTTCEPYSQTIRCRTEIWASTNGVQGWVFNNLTYLPFMTRAQWASNPLGVTGEWTAADGRRWRTECDTAATGRNGCRSYTWATGSGWVFNNLVRFRI